MIIKVECPHCGKTFYYNTTTGGTDNEDDYSEYDDM